MMSSEEKERNMKEQREKEKTTVPHECTQSRSVAVRFLDPSLLRSPVRASFAMLRSDKHPPLDPSSSLSVNPSVPLSKSTERSLTRAARRAQPPLRPHRDLTAVVKAEREREQGRSHRRLRSTAHGRSSSHLAVAAHLPLPCESDFSFFSPPPPPSSPPSPPPPNLGILWLTDLLPQQLFSLSLSSSHRCRQKNRGSYRRAPLPSDRFPPSRFEAACCGHPLSAAEGQRDAPCLPCSLVLYFVPLDLIPFASSLFE